MIERSVFMTALLATCALSPALTTAAVADGLKYTKLTLLNGWTGAPFATRAPAVAIDKDEIVHFKGAMETAGSDPAPFRLPGMFRPKTVVYVTVDLCNGAKGRIVIQPDGATSIYSTTTFSDAQCFTSLEGVSYSK